MSIDPAVERERVHEKYAAMTRPWVLLWLFGFGALLVASRFVTVGWYFYAGVVSGLVGWEVTKWRLRKNADRFAGTRI